MSFDTLWYLADEADQQAEQVYHRLHERHGEFVERTNAKYVSRDRFRTLVGRIKRTGAPYGAHTVVYRESGELLLVRHEGVNMWVLPGGGIDGDETFRETAERELREEAGVEVDYGGLGLLGRIEISCDEHATWGVLPVFEAEALTTTPEVRDPDEEISEARWFDELPEDTRDRADLLAWREHALA